MPVINFDELEKKEIEEAVANEQTRLKRKSLFWLAYMFGLSVGYSAWLLNERSIAPLIFWIASLVAFLVLFAIHTFADNIAERSVIKRYLKKYNKEIKEDLKDKDRK